MDYALFSQIEGNRVYTGQIDPFGKLSDDRLQHPLGNAF
jgi:hypothetical protein